MRGINLQAHIRLLEWRMYGLIMGKQTAHTKPILFEYYSAVQLSYWTKTPFNVWADISPEQKTRFNLPVPDTGIDVANDEFTVLGQCKYYGKDICITRKKLSTFIDLGTERAKKNKDNNRKTALILFRTNHSTIDNGIQSMVDKGKMLDIQFCDQQFISDLDYIKRSFL
jgi:hypothetical protein